MRSILGDLSGFIRWARVSRGLTQAELAGMVGTDQGVISAYEHGRRSPSAEMLNRIVVACGYRLAALDTVGRVFPAPIPKAGWFSDEYLHPDHWEPEGSEGDLETRGPTAWSEAARDAALVAVVEAAAIIAEDKARS